MDNDTITDTEIDRIIQEHQEHAKCLNTEEVIARVVEFLKEHNKDYAIVIASSDTTDMAGSVALRVATANGSATIRFVARFIHHLTEGRFPPEMLQAIQTCLSVMDMLEETQNAAAGSSDS